MSNKNNEIKPKEYTYNGKSLTFIKPLVMAIVNVTPDSFYDGNKYGNVSDVLRDIESKIKNGAGIIDLGAASSRPGAAEVSEAEEWERLEVVLIEARKEFKEVFISIDTYRSTIARKSSDLGADIINDISGGNFDPEMFRTVAELQIPYILMHIRGNPQSMQVNPVYQDVVEELKKEFSQKIATLNKLGFHKIILDPGFGFGKTNEHNFRLLKFLNELKISGLPVLAGISRKSMINKIIHTNPVTSLNGTTVLNTIALLNGCNILRVHDALEAKQAIELVEYYKNA